MVVASGIILSSPGTGGTLYFPFSHFHFPFSHFPFPIPNSRSRFPSPIPVPRPRPRPSPSPSRLTIIGHMHQTHFCPDQTILSLWFREGRSSQLMRNARAKFCKSRPSECGRSEVRTGLPAITKVLACCANQSGALGQRQPIRAQDTAAPSVLGCR